MATCIAALRLSDDSDSAKFLDKFDSVSETDKNYLSIEEIAVAAEVSPKRLLELCISALVEDSRSAGAIVAASYHPRVIRATAENAIKWADAESDRKTFLAGTGFTPQPTNRPGGVFNVNFNTLNPVPPTVSAELAAGDDDSVHAFTFNAAEDDLKTLHEYIDGAKLLEAPKVVENASQIRIGHQYRDDGDLSPVPVPAQRHK